MMNPVSRNAPFDFLQRLFVFKFHLTSCFKVKLPSMFRLFSPYINPRPRPLFILTSPFGRKHTLVLTNQTTEQISVSCCLHFIYLSISYISREENPLYQATTCPFLHNKAGILAQRVKCTRKWRATLNQHLTNPDETNTKDSIKQNPPNCQFPNNPIQVYTSLLPK